MRKAYSVLRVPYIGLSVLAIAALLVAYQTRAPIVLDLAATDEARYLSGFYAPEVTAGVTHRWTDGEATIVLRGLGRAPIRLSLNLQAIRPASTPITPVTITVNDQDMARFTPGPDLAAYNFDLPDTAIDARGDVVIGLQSDTFRPSEAMGSADQRTLGLFVDRVALEFGSGFIVPPPIAWLLLTGSPLIVYGLGRLRGQSRRASFVPGLLLLIAEVVAVVIARAWTGYNAPWLAGTLLTIYLVSLRLKRSVSRITPLRSASGAIAYQVSRPTFVARHSSLVILLAVFLVWRSALVIIPLVGSSVVGVPECCPQVDPQPVTNLSQAAFGHWYRWDAIWYGSIAQNGYQYFGEREASNVGFFPLTPILNGAVMRVAGWPVEVAGPIVSTLLAFAACVMLYRLTRRETDDAEVASRSVIYLLVFPAAYYLAIGYSEALYLLCVLAAFWWAREGRWGLSGIAAFLAGLTRLHGALLIVPLAYEYFRQRGFKLRADALAVPAAPLGVLAFNLYLNLQFGQPADYFSPYFEIQALFFKGIRAEAFPTFPTTTLANYVGGLFNGPPTTEGVIVVGATILMLILTLETWLRLPRVYGVYMLTVALFSLIGGDLISMPRFVVPLFPGFMALGLIGRRTWLDRVILIVSVALLGVLALMFVKGYWLA